ncbi:MAG: hypothetical protein JO179_03130 [Solirubrobacterales bacterium]|nr:hypothetical protein [Solirubrobacterales bacterium]
MAEGTHTLEQVAERLYELPLEEFTAARDDTVKQLRADGDRDVAAEVKRLRKPNRVAWALNRARRREPDKVQQLIAAGAQLQQAQRQLVSAGERGLLRSAVAEERELVGEVVALAERELAEGGHPATPTEQRKLYSTLHAAAVDAQVRDALAAGRLQADHEIGDLGLASTGLADAGPAPAADRGDPAPASAEPAPSTKPAAGRASAAAERKARQVAKKVERAKDRRRRLDQKLKDSGRALAQAEREAAQAAAAVERANAALKRAQQDSTDAAWEVEELEAELAAAREETVR